MNVGIRKMIEQMHAVFKTGFSDFEVVLAIDFF